MFPRCIRPAGCACSARCAHMQINQRTRSKSNFVVFSESYFNPPYEFQKLARIPSTGTSNEFPVCGLSCICNWRLGLICPQMPLDVLKCTGLNRFITWGSSNNNYCLWSPAPAVISWVVIFLSKSHSSSASYQVILCLKSRSHSRPFCYQFISCLTLQTQNIINT